MLANISKLLTGDILKVLCDMGHGDTIILADGNFPTGVSPQRLIHVPGITVTQLLEGMLPIFPIDVAYSQFPASVMEMTDGDRAKGLPDPVAWADYERVLRTCYPDLQLGKIERFDFYTKIPKAYAVIRTGDSRPYGNLLLTKGCV